MLKYFLSESIKNTKTLLDTIQEYEDKTGFPVVRKYYSGIVDIFFDLIRKE